MFVILPTYLHRMGGALMGSDCRIPNIQKSTNDLCVSTKNQYHHYNLGYGK